MAERRGARDAVIRNRAEAIIDFVLQNAVLFSHQGSVQESWRSYGEHRLGPFFRLVFRIDGKTRTVYLGADPAFAGRVQKMLTEIQRPLREKRLLRAHQELVRKAFKTQRIELEEQLQSMGLYFKGNEVRGWRNAALNGVRGKP
jgi:hypothetical protein